MYVYILILFRGVVYLHAFSPSSISELQMEYFPLNSVLLLSFNFRVVVVIIDEFNLLYLKITNFKRADEI